jgi:hypothetical protein
MRFCEECLHKFSFTGIGPYQRNNRGHLDIACDFLMWSRAMMHSQFAGIIVASMVGVGAIASPSFGQSGSSAPPQKPAASNGADTDLGCRRQAAAQTGYSGSSSSSTSDDAEKRYADAYMAAWIGHTALRGRQRVRVTVHRRRPTTITHLILIPITGRTTIPHTIMDLASS